MPNLLLCFLNLFQRHRNCSAHYSQGYVFTIYYWSGGSNYFHLTYDMMLPLYKQIYHGRKNVHKKSEEAGSVLLMPSVETSRLKVLIFFSPKAKKSTICVRMCCQVRVVYLGCTMIVSCAAIVFALFLQKYLQLRFGI